jgi:hypothetical protein
MLSLSRAARLTARCELALKRREVSSGDQLTHTGQPQVRSDHALMVAVVLMVQRQCGPVGIWRNSTAPPQLLHGKSPSRGAGRSSERV